MAYTLFPARYEPFTRKYLLTECSFFSELQLVAQKNTCETERLRGYDAQNIESGLLQDYISRLKDSYTDLLKRHADLQNSHADLQNSHADLQAQFRRFSNEGLSAGSNVEGQ